MKPIAPIRMKVPRQPSHRNSTAISGADTIAPIDAPALNTPCAKARSRAGNHSALAFTAPGQAPASLMPSIARTRLKDRMEWVTECSAIEIDQTAIDSAKPSRVPMMSNRRPNTNCPAA
ncbi:hypothetical protein D3C71_1257710 [compost metagenome]